MCVKGDLLSLTESFFIWKTAKNLILADIIADIPKAISKCLTNISCNKNVFDMNVGIYQAALKNSGFDGKIKWASR